MKKKIALCLVVVMAAMTLTACGDLKTELIKYIYGRVDEPDDIKEATCISEGRYVHDLLSEEEQIVYDQMLECIMNMEESRKLSTADADVMSKCFDAVNADWGQLYWYDGCQYLASTDKNDQGWTDFIPNYTMTIEDRQAMDDLIATEIDEYMAAMNDCKDQYSKVEELYRMMINRVDYDEEAEDNQNILSVFKNKKTVCRGYANAVQFLLSEQGIQSAVVSGETEMGPHAWNLVRVDGDYYYVDVTWGHNRYSDTDGNVTDAGISFDYLLVNDDDIKNTHVSNVGYKLPRCNSSEANYYNKKGLYFDGWDESKVGPVIKKATKKGKKYVAIKFSQGLYLNQAVDALIDEGHLKKYNGNPFGQAYYTSDSDMNILRIYFERE